ncbi:MAG: hypothetical protein FWG16_02990 [Micrococcales bacterium]|nr:hypothetical protein [Micrococcales bacterium]
MKHFPSPFQDDLTISLSTDKRATPSQSDQTDPNPTLPWPVICITGIGQKPEIDTAPST